MSRNLIASLLIVLGLIVVTAGVAMLHVPAGVVCAGCAFVATGWLVGSGGEQA